MLFNSSGSQDFGVEEKYKLLIRLPINVVVVAVNHHHLLLQFFFIESVQ